MEGYGEYDAVGLAELVRRGEVSPTDLLDAARARMAVVNPSLNAVVVELDRPVSAEVGDAPFRGVPFLLKDLGQELAGHPTSDGSRALARFVRPETATVVRRWLDAGLVVFGRTNTPEFGAKGVTEPHLYGPTRNPWNTDHSPGGSSGGAAAAVAAGIVPCAAASDGGGSIRIPASACGLFGLKPSRGLVPSGPAVSEGLAGSATHGVISRSVRDTAAMLDVLAGGASDGPYLPRRHETPYLEEVGRDPGRLRIAACTASTINPSPDPEAVRAVENAAQLLVSLGHEVVWLDEQPFDDEAVARNFLTTWFAWGASAVDNAKQVTGAGDSSFEPDTLVMAALGRATKPVELVRAIEARQGHIRRLAAFHAGHDLLLTPTTATPPPRIGALNPPRAAQLAQVALLRARAAGVLRFSPIVGQLITAHLGWVPYTQIANLTGRPAMTVPLHWTATGLPLGVQFIGALGAEPVLLRLAAQLEQAQPWATRRPPEHVA
ncbi:amidase [Kribbella sp. NPDC005582]|uniref:amidase n=1 Tax=Kribbella sp. NPDC005582 TaxID=3156893 RepID=UPI0033B1A42D